MASQDSSDDVVFASSAPTKKHIPWRLPNVAKTLETALIRVALVKKIHIHQEVDAEGKKESIDDRWKLVADDVFRQPEFAG